MASVDNKETECGSSLLFATFFYNRGEQLEATIDSMLVAALPGTEILVVDDGSTDDTSLRLVTYKDRVSVRIQDNSGFTNSIIEAIESSSSEFIAICGSGDVSHPERLLRQMQVMMADSSIAFCGTASRNINALTGDTIDTQSFRAGELDAADFRSSPPFTHGTVLFRRSAYQAVGGYDRRFLFSQDWDLWLRMLSVGKGYFIDEPLYDRRVLTDGASFNAGKAERQLLFKYAALELHDCGQLGRDELLDRICRQGVKALSQKQRAELRQDLSTRYFKLLLGGYALEASELIDLIRERHGGLKPALHVVDLALRGVSHIGIDLSRLQVMARWLLAAHRRQSSKKSI